MNSVILKPSVIDASLDTRPHLQALRDAGVETVFRYLNPLGESAKSVSVAEASAIANAGLRLGLVSEGWGDFAHNGISQRAGVRDAQHALKIAPSLGINDDAIIYFAVDTDANWGQIFNLVIPYFVAVKQTAGEGARIGVYGSGAVCQTLAQRQLVSACWLAGAMGWLESKQFYLSRKWSMAQGKPTHVGGVECDVNVTNGIIGDFVPTFDVAQTEGIKVA